MNSKENNTQTIIETLSPAEQEMIVANRLKAEAEAKEKAAKKALDHEKQIKNEKETIQKDLAAQAKHKTVVDKFLAELVAIDPNFMLDVRKYNKTYECYDYDYVADPEKEGRTKSVKTVYFTETVPMEDYTIKHKLVNKDLEVREHIARGNYGRTNHGYKLYFKYDKNIGYKNAARVAEVIKEVLAKAEREIKAKNNKATAKDLAEVELKTKYPDGTLTHTQEHTRYYGYIDIWKVAFANGISVKYRYELHEGKLKLNFEDIGGISGTNIEKVIDALKGI